MSDLVSLAHPALHDGLSWLLGVQQFLKGLHGLRCLTRPLCPLRLPFIEPLLPAVTFRKAEKYPRDQDYV